MVPGPVNFFPDPAGDSWLRLQSASIDPNPPRMKRPFTITYSFVSTETIESGAKLSEVWTLGLTEVLRRTTDLCELLALSGYPCPLPPGPYRLVVPYPSMEPIPLFVTVIVRQEFASADGALLRLQTRLTFGPG